MLQIITLRDAVSVFDEPNEYLEHWRIAVRSTGERHFCGIRQNGTTVRVSSQIVSFNHEQKRGVTRSGRVYQLDGLPGDPDHLRLGLAVWCQANGIAPASMRFVDD